LWIAYFRQGFHFFSPQDFALYSNYGKGRVPESAKTATFEPVMKQYFDLAKLLVTLAGASIVFGGLDPKIVGIYRSKLVLAMSIFFCLMFYIFCLKSYEDYTHDFTSYKAWKIALVESFGLSGIFLFFYGYVAWIDNLNLYHIQISK
jgi:hypothetical protein